MSFQDLHGGGTRMRQLRNLDEHPRQQQGKPKMNSLPTCVEIPAPKTSSRDKAYRRSTSTGKLLTNPRRTMIVLHGRVQQHHEDEFPPDEDGPEEEPSHIPIRTGSSSSRKQSLHQDNSSSIRSALERKSNFSRLSHETQLFGRMVTDLEALLAESGESPEAAWRARILMRSAQETDKELWGKLDNYEKTLYGDKDDVEVRQAQTACMKLHRDFKRIHKSLVLALSFFEKRQRAEISRLGAVGWSTGDFALEEPPEIRMKTPTRESEMPKTEPVDEDFFDRAIREREAFDRAMRQKEIEMINQKMHTVNDIYSELAQVVDVQQEKIDQLEDDAESAKYNVRAARRSSIFDFDTYCAGREGVSETKCSPEKVGDDIDWEGLFSCGSISHAAGVLRESYGFSREEASDHSSYSDESPVAVEPNSRNNSILASHCKNSSSSTDSRTNDERLKKKAYREDYSQSQRRLRRDESFDSDPTRNSRDKVSEKNIRSGSRSTVESDKGGSRRRRRKGSNKRDDANLRVSEEFHWMMPFETLTEDVKAVQGDLITWGKGIITSRRTEDSSTSSKQCG